MCIAPDELWLGFAARLEPGAAPLLFVAAATAAMRRFDHVRALGIGTGEQARLVAEAIAESGFGERFRWLYDDAALPLLGGVDLLVITGHSIAASEVLRGAALGGVPVLTVPLAGQHGAGDGGPAIVASSEALPGVLLALLANAERVRALKQNARLIAEQPESPRASEYLPLPGPLLGDTP